MKTDNPATGIIGKYVGNKVKEEADHFYVCAACGQAVDCRDLGQVFHHEEEGHEPLDMHS